MEIIKLIWDILKTLWDVGKNVGPFLAKRLRLHRGTWQILVRKGAKRAGTPIQEVENLLEAFENPTFYIGTEGHSILEDTRKSIWRIHQRLDELRMLALAELSEDEDEQCWAIGQVGQRSGTYAIPVLQAISESLGSPDRVKKATMRAIWEINKRDIKDRDCTPPEQVGQL